VQWPVLAELPEDDRRRVLQAARRRRYARHEVIFHEGDPGDTLHLIAKGRVAVAIATPLGDSTTLTVLGAGQFFGELALVGNQPVRTATVAALEPTETLALRQQQFDELRRDHPTIDRFLVAILAEQVKRLSTQLLEALFVDAETRVLRRLLDLAQEYGEGLPGTVIPLTQEDIATMAGTTRPTTNRVLRDAEAAGAIRIARARTEIVDPSILIRWAK
jgi:CRP/FNR family transcriptional regulator, cyclic AMP receptor protein